MGTRLNRSFSILISFVLLAMAPSLFAQGTPINGTARVSADLLTQTASPGSVVRLSVTVDLSGVTGQGPSGTTAAVLGAFQIAVGFDPARVRFDGASGGTASGYQGAPVFTNPGSANAAGSVSLAASQTSSTSPTGAVNIFTLNFTALTAGTTNFNVTPTSLASAFQPPSSGPTSIPATGSSASLTIANLPTAPSDPNPPDGATGVAVPVTLSWSGSSDASRYEVYFGTSSNPGFIGEAATTTKSVTAVTGTTYYWRVVGINTAGSVTGPTWSFKTGGNAPCTNPAMPVINAPAEAVGSTNYRVAWTAVAGATEYRVEESTDSTFGSSIVTVVASPSTEAIFSHPVTAATTYYYRVAARNGSGNCNEVGLFSPTVAVLVTLAPPPPVLLRVVPVVASTPGNFGSFFRTAVQLHNRGDSAMSGTMTFHSAGKPGSASDAKLNYSIGAGQTLYYPDILVAMQQAGIGSLDITSSSGFPVAVIRVFNDGGAAGTTGFVEDLVSSEDALEIGEMAVIIAPPDTIAARLNIGVRTLASGATLDVTVRSMAGQVVRTLRKTYPANYFIQSSDADFLESQAGLVASDTLSIKVSAGSAIVYGASTDNKTNDPSMQVGRRAN